MNLVFDRINACAMVAHTGADLTSTTAFDGSF